MLVTSILLGSFALQLVAALTAQPEAKLAPVTPRQSTSCNTAANRQCWSEGFDILTDSEKNWPHKNDTAPEKFYHIIVSEMELSPFGTPKKMLVVNGTYPGPTLIADWGDRMTITVTNNMTDNGTSIHWHGVVQMNSNTEDGVNGITECPIPPGASRVYSFIATQHGTTWYHSHTSAQYGDGVLGTMIINGPAVVNYEEDLGTFPLSDYFPRSIWTENQAVLPAGSPPATSLGATFNGTMKDPSTNTGHYFNRTLQSNTTYRLRLINTAVDNGFAVSFDHHKLTVIEADFVPIRNYTTDWLLINIGQRYDVVFTTDQDPSNYWFRAVVPNPGCGRNTLSAAGKILAIFNYGNVTLAEPPITTPPTPPPTVCNDEKNLIPYTNKSVPQIFKFVPDKTDQMNVSLTQVQASPESLATGLVNSWIINEQAIDVAWERPTLEYVAEGNTDNLAKQLNVYRIPNKDQFYFWVIQSQVAAHPIHLHGHDFYLLGQTNGTTRETFTTATDMARLNFENPPRRDVALLPANGWIVIAFQADNPGAWLLHCHIAFHISGGLGIQFLEREQDIRGGSLPNLGKINQTCMEFENYYQNATFKKTDSGLRL